MLVCADHVTGMAGINWLTLTSLSSVSASENLPHVDESLRREGEELAQGHTASWRRKRDSLPAIPWWPGAIFGYTLQSFESQNPANNMVLAESPSGQPSPDGEWSRGNMEIN